MEKAGTGGAIFRNFYRDFLKEAYEITQLEPINQAYQHFIDIAPMWTQVANLLDQAGVSGDEQFIEQASALLVILSDKEYNAMKILERVS